MKRLLLADSRDELLTTLEVILKHWGYRVLATSRPADILQSLETSPPELLILGEDLLNSSSDQLNLAFRNLLQEQSTAIILLKSASEAAPLQTQVPRLDVPVNLFVLFEKVQAYLEDHPRRNLRLDVKIPGMVCQGERSNLAEVISVSNQGLFIKTTFQLGSDDNLRVVIPLIGMQKELDLPGKVIYRMEPSHLNNYRQGVGIEFTGLGEVEQGLLDEYLEKRFLEELSETRRGQDFVPSQIRRQSEDLVRIVRLP
jgi:Tfp pilus assembly protein PilZ/CheY-like chemotaxis protein